MTHDQINLGNFWLGYSQVNVVARTGDGGEFYGGEAPPRIKIGVHYQYFEEAMTVAMHEAAEFVMTVGKCRYEQTDDMSNDHSGYVFMFNHVEFSDLCTKTARFLEDVRPHLYAAWQLFNPDIQQNHHD